MGIMGINEMKIDQRGNGDVWGEVKNTGEGVFLTPDDQGGFNGEGVPVILEKTRDAIKISPIKKSKKERGGINIFDIQNVIEDEQKSGGGITRQALGGAMRGRERGSADCTKEVIDGLSERIVTKKKIGLMIDFLESEGFIDIMEEGRITFAMIKPDVNKPKYQNKTDEEVEEMIKNRIEDPLEIIMEQSLVLTKEQVEEFYSDLKDKKFFPEHLRFMTSGPITAIILYSDGEEKAFKEWRDQMGPTDPKELGPKGESGIRFEFAKDKSNNATHGSDSVVNVKREVSLFVGWLKEIHQAL